MKAAIHEAYGKLDVVRIAEIDRPAPTDDQVLAVQGLRLRNGRRTGRRCRTHRRSGPVTSR